MSIVGFGVDTAVHVWVSDLLDGSSVLQEDEPTGILLKDGATIVRARLYGIVVSSGDLVVDDGSGSILVKSFDRSFVVNIGDCVLVIGRPRIYDSQFYILGEIVKKVDSKWLKVRERLYPRSDPVSVVRALDKGDGADYNELVARLGEDKIAHLLAVGELFETRPGKLKVLD